ncbi:CsiV family protein [Thiomicrorhabdus sp. Milos-T2]|uniref:CsiV family protein n=1 Tax=Thiomicrorhabdus sp. Milos-T2 TaxID=90814 RepID=UPI00068DBE80|nr:CsiV family protein [Thiomicrorhabdus sp. Milos-T2]
MSNKIVSTFKRLSILKNQLAVAILFANLALFTSQAQAQVPSYKIEVIVFENLNLKGWTEEHWPDQIELPSTENSTSIFTRNQKPLWINRRNQSLVGTEAKLNKRGYRVIFHQAWSQLAYANKKAPTVLIENDQKRGANLIGTVRLYKTRFAHVDFDLELERRIPSKILEKFAQNQGISAGEAPTHWRFNIKESRKIKPGELHYIDHPLFGVLVKITPNK